MGRIRFRDREDAGRQLAVELRDYAKDHPIVLAIPNGGVPVGFEVSRALGCELDFWVVKKLAVPWHPELGVGAIAEGGQLSIARAMIEDINLSGVELANVTEIARRASADRVSKYRGARPKPDLRMRTVIVIDDGLFTGGTAHAAIESLRAQSPRQIVLAVPVGAPGVVSRVGQRVERVVCLNTPTELYALGLWYDDFPRVSDEQAMRFIERAQQAFATSQAAARNANAALPVPAR